jgi:hypothetical protein
VEISHTRRSRGKTKGRVAEDETTSERLSEREAQRERSPQEGGQEGEGVEAREKEVKMDLEEEREDSAPIPGKIGNLAEETTPEEENETP